LNTVRYLGLPAEGLGVEAPALFEVPGAAVETEQVQRRGDQRGEEFGDAEVEEGVEGPAEGVIVELFGRQSRSQQEVEGVVSPELRGEVERPGDEA